MFSMQKMYLEEAVTVVTVLPPPVGMDSRSPHKNLPGFGKETSLGTAVTATLPLTPPVVNTLECKTSQLCTVQE
jgi:hypothetical protein